VAMGDMKTAVRDSFAQVFARQFEVSQ
jgi:hypothetical protein